MKRQPRRCRSLLCAVLGFLFLNVKLGLIHAFSCSGTNQKHCKFASRSIWVLDGTSFEENQNFDDAEDATLLESSPVSPVSRVWEEQRTDREESESLDILSRKENWLQEATEGMLDVEKVPLGSLNQEEMGSIVDLMYEWSRRRSFDAATAVEHLLKRIVDDMHAGNSDVFVTTRMYTITIDAWARSGKQYGAQRAQQIHDGMINLYQQTKDANISPDTLSFNTLLNAWAKSFLPESHERAEEIFRDMIDLNLENAKPDASTFASMLEIYSKSKDTAAIQKSEKLFSLMNELNIQPDQYTYSSLQSVYGRSGLKNAPEKCQQVLEKMLQLYQNGDFLAKPKRMNYNAVLGAYSRTTTSWAARKVEAMLDKMERAVSDGGYDIEPDRISYSLAILTCSRCPDSAYAADSSERLLMKMEERAKVEAEKRAEISSAAPPPVTLDIECFNCVLMAISVSRQPGSALRAAKIVRRMENYSKNGNLHITPNTRSWNALLQCIARSDEDLSQKAEQLLTHMFELNKNGTTQVKPDAFTFVAVLSTYKKLQTRKAAERADEIIEWMEKLYERGDIDFHPDTIHYSIVCVAWSKVHEPRAGARVLEILSKMQQKDKEGIPRVRPNTRTYNTCLDTLCRSGKSAKAEQLLYHMLTLSKGGDNTALPDSFSFNVVISGYARSAHYDAGRRAESVLDRFIEFSEENPRVKPDARSFTHIIAHYTRAKKMPDAPYRAEYMLNRLIAMFESDKSCVPNVFAFTTVMDAYASHKHPDAGEYAERLMRTMRKLKKKYDLADIEVNTGVMNNVLSAYLESGNANAGNRANMLVEDMEKRADFEGDRTICPNSRTYSLAISIWAKMDSDDKAEQALRYLRRMKTRKEKQNLAFRPDDHHYGLVINACAFTTGNADKEKRAFEIATNAMEDAINDSSIEIRRGTIFGWFIQACERLNVDKALKEEQIEYAFTKCCELGLVNDFVLECFLKAAPDTLLEKVMGSILDRPKNDREGRRQTVSNLRLRDLPIEWKRTFQKQRQNAEKKKGRRPGFTRNANKNYKRR